MAEAKNIHALIGQAMRKIGAIGKDKKNPQQGFMYRGIDAVYNALSPVMAELGLFLCPEVIEQRREERTNKNGTVLLYTILTVKYTIYAPDGSSVSCVVVGEAMDSGDKSCNKAMSAAFKYAAFQLFCIPTEEMIDPDNEVHTDVLPRGAQKPVQTKQTPKADPPADVEKTPVIPNPENPVATYLAKEKKNLQSAREITAEENAELFTKQLAILRQAGKVPNKGLSAYTQAEAEDLIAKMYTLFDPLGTELKDVDAL